jgi:hypothetical protein
MVGPPQHFLNFFPLPQGYASFRPTLGCMALATVRSQQEAIELIPSDIVTVLYSQTLDQLV